MAGSPLTSGQSQFVSTLSGMTGLNPGVLTAWVLAEENGGAAQARQASGNHNWLNIGYFDSGPGKIASDKAFSNPISAARQTAAFLKGQWGGAAPGIRSILSTAHKDPMSQINAIASSPWASSHYNGGATLRSLFAMYAGHAPAAGKATPSAGGYGVSGGVSPQPSAQSQPSGPDYSSALVNALLNQSAGAKGDILQKALSTATAAPSLSDTLDKELGLSGGSAPTSHPAAKAQAQQRLAPRGNGRYVNPHPGATLGRIDQGIDYNLRPGSPIRALGDAKIIGILPNWFRGQPLVYYKLLSGPDAGKYVYEAEQITPSVRPGQIVRAGDVIGHYASSGTGVEEGWATASGATLARATTGYTEGQVTPAGSSFAQFLKSLGG